MRRPMIDLMVLGMTDVLFPCRQNGADARWR
jgi:hypothetical protein